MNLNLKMKIHESGRSQISIAHEIDIPEPLFSKIVNEWIIPEDHLKEKIAHALHCSVEEIFPIHERAIDQVKELAAERAKK